MAHHTATKKSIKQTAIRNERNTARETRIRTAVKNLRKSVSEADKDGATKNLRIAQSEINKGVTKGVIKKNTASRIVSRLNASVKKIAA